MTESMVERVARVIIAGFDEVTEPDEREDCLNLARAAISAMREPTEAMLKMIQTGDAPYADMSKREEWNKDANHYYSPLEFWQNVIDEALK